MKTNLILCSLLLLLTPSSLRAVTTYNLIWDGTVATTYDLGDTTTNNYLMSSYGAGTALPPFTADFSADKDIDIVFSAISGQAIQVNPPDTASDLASFIVGLRSAITLQGLFVDGTFHGATFTGLTGTAPTVGYGSLQHATSSFFGGGNPQFDALVRLDSTSPYSFTSLKLSFTAPSGMDMVYNNAALQGEVYGTMQDATSDPGQWVTLSAVPEPSRAMLWMAGLVALVFCRTRRR